VIGNRFAARGLDFLGDVIGGRLRFFLPRDRDPKIVDYYCASLRGECPRDAAADTAPVSDSRRPRRLPGPFIVPVGSDVRTGCPALPSFP